MARREHGHITLVEGLIVVLFCVGGHDACPTGWTHNRRLDTCIRAVRLGLPWRDAKGYCRSINAHLLDLVDWTEQSFVNATASTRTGYGMWLGARISSFGTWEWTDDRHMNPNTFQWAKESHPFGDGWFIKDKKCLVLLTTVHPGELMDVDCDHDLPFLCEAPRSSFPETPKPPSTSTAATFNATLAQRGETSAHITIPVTLSVVSLVIISIIVAMIIYRRRRSIRKTTAPQMSSSQEDILGGEGTLSAVPSRVEFSDVVTENTYEDIGEETGTADNSYENVTVTTNTNDCNKNNVIPASPGAFMCGKTPRRKDTPRRVVVNKSYAFVKMANDTILKIQSAREDPASSGNVYYLHPVK